MKKTLLYLIFAILGLQQLKAQCPDGLSVTTSSTNVLCNGDNEGTATAIPSSGYLPYTYSWVPGGETNSTATGLTFGCYTVTVTDTHGCTITASSCISQPALLTATMGAPINVSCFNASNGQLNVTAAGGTTPYTYEWSPLYNISLDYDYNLTAGCYTVIVTDNNGCSATAASCITQPLALTATIGAVTNLSCNGGNNGAITVTAGGGTSPYTYNWAPNGGTSPTATGLTVGCYTVTVTDDHGCTATASACLTQPALFGVYITSSTGDSCNGGNNGRITTGVYGGVAPYSYSWYPGGADTALSSGTYTVSAVDANGCVATANATITQPPLLTATIGSIINNTNCINPNGSTGVIGSGGTLPYTYLWNPTGQTNANATGLAAGSYTCTIIDNHACSATASVAIGGPSAPVLTLSSTPDTGTCAGTATASVTGGTLPYTYLWAPGGSTNSSISGLCAGLYQCRVTDNGGCTDTGNIVIDTCINLFNEPICIISLDTATDKCELIWGRTSSPPSGGYGHYNIYRDSTSGFTLTHTQPLNVLSEYIDPNSNPSAGPVSYKISTVDSCGESALSSVHTSIYLTTTSGVNVYILNWTAYVGFTPVQYDIFRGPSLSNLTLLDSVPNTVLTYHDTLPPLGSYYVLEAVSPHGPCIPSSHRPNHHSISLTSGSFSNGFNTGTLLGVNNLANEVNNLNIYPNPSNGMFTLNYSITQSDNVRISIINELRQEVYAEQKQINAGPNTEQLNIENLASGIYSLRIQTNNSNTIRKLLIMRNK